MGFVGGMGGQRLLSGYGVEMSENASLPATIQQTKTQRPVVLSSDFFTADRRKSLRESVWLFGLLLARVGPSTGEWGMVNGGEPVTLRQLSSALGVSQSTIKSDLRRLKSAGLVESVPNIGGLKLRVRRPELPRGWGEANLQLPLQVGSELGSASHTPVPAGNPTPLVGPYPGEDGETNRYGSLANAYRRLRRSFGFRGAAVQPDFRDVEAALAFIRKYENWPARELVCELEMYAAEVPREEFTLGKFITWLKTRTWTLTETDLPLEKTG